MAGGLQHGAPTQQSGLSDAGRVRRERRRATGVSPHAGRVYCLGMGKFGCAGT